MEWENGPLINGGSDDGDIHQGLSHHLAHAYSTAAQAPFDWGLRVVMDGVGETYCHEVFYR
jgi:predicted NodU family carbamoyl transferase